jgi:hypothetical protein
MMRTLSILEMELVSGAGDVSDAVTVGGTVALYVWGCAGII